MSRHHHSGAAQSQRMLRVAELVRHQLAEMLTRGMIDEPILRDPGISIVEARMSPDLKLATIYVRAGAGSDPQTALAAFERHKKYLRGEIARAINLRYAPELRFRADDALARGARIDALLRDPAVQRDLALRPGEDSKV
jgi:ribosome-binding factor A